MDGLFNYQDPRVLQQKYLDNRQINAAQMAQLPLLNQVAAIGGNTGAALGTSLGRLFGGRTAAEVENEAMKEIFTGAAQQSEDPVERMALAAQGLRQRGLEGRAIQLEQEAAKLQQTRAATRKTELSLEQEENLRKELAALGPEATPEQVEAVVLKYGDPDKILASLQRTQDRQADREFREEEAKRRHQERLEIARENNASRAQIAQMNMEFRAELERMRQDARQEAAQQKQANRTLPASLQKSEDADFELIDAAEGVVEDIKPIIANLRPDPATGKPPLDLSRFNNMQFQAKAFLGSDDPEVQRYQQLERNLTRFVNESLRLNKGVQTEGDAQRAANEVQSAFSKSNTESMRKALEELQKINERAAKNRRAQVDRRRTSQGIEPFFGQPQQQQQRNTTSDEDLVNKYLK